MGTFPTSRAFEPWLFGPQLFGPSAFGPWALCPWTLDSWTFGTQTHGSRTLYLLFCSEKLNIQSLGTDNLPCCQEVFTGLSNYSQSCLTFLKFSKWLCSMCNTLCAAQLFLLQPELRCMSPVHELSYQAGSVFLRAPTIWQFHFVVCEIIFFRKV